MNDADTAQSVEVGLPGDMLWQPAALEGGDHLLAGLAIDVGHVEAIADF